MERNRREFSTAITTTVVDVPLGLEEHGVAIGLTWHAVGLAVGLAVGIAVVFHSLHAVGLFSRHPAGVAMARTVAALWLMATHGAYHDNSRLALGTRRKPRGSPAVARELPWLLPWYATTRQYYKVKYCIPMEIDP